MAPLWGWWKGVCVCVFVKMVQKGSCSLFSVAWNRTLANIICTPAGVIAEIQQWCYILVWGGNHFVVGKDSCQYLPLSHTHTFAQASCTDFKLNLSCPRCGWPSHSELRNVPESQYSHRDFILMQPAGDKQGERSKRRGEQGASYFLTLYMIIEGGPEELVNSERTLVGY